MGLVDHVKAALTLALITLNLLFWIVPLAVLALVRLIAKGDATRSAMASIYRIAVRIDDFFLRSMGADWRLAESGGAKTPAKQLSLPRDEPVLVICNHRSWADIFIIQSIVVRDGPIVVFLAKRELAWIPILGVIFLALEFPLLRRSKSRGAGDIDRVDAACRRLNDAPSALLSFAEGTRFSVKKRSTSPGFDHLLPPRCGGVEAFARAVPDSRLVDLTLVYPGDASFWRFLAGRSGSVTVDVEMTTAPSADVGDWLNDRWARKDALLKRYYQRLERSD